MRLIFFISDTFSSEGTIPGLLRVIVDLSIFLLGAKEIYRMNGFGAITQMGCSAILEMRIATISLVTRNSPEQIHLAVEIELLADIFQVKVHCIWTEGEFHVYIYISQKRAKMEEDAERNLASGFDTATALNPQFDGGPKLLRAKG